MPFLDRCRRLLIPTVGGFLGIVLMASLAHASGIPLAVVPFTTSIVLVMAAPESPQAQPWNVFGGHVLSALAGLVAVTVFGPGEWTAAIGVGLAITFMLGARALHPPAGIDALLPAIMPLGWSFLVMPVAAGAAILVAFATLYHRLSRPGIWPKRGA